MRHGIRGLVCLGGLGLLLAGNLSAQRIDSETQRATLTGLRSFAVHTRVQLLPSAALQRIEESVLRGRIEGALRREGISIETRNDVRDGSQASLELLYMVMETRDTSGRSIGFAASSCLQVSQMVRIPRLTTPKHIAYAVVSTWQSCGLLVGDSASFRPTLLQNADEHITRFIDAWRSANAPPPHPRQRGPVALRPRLSPGVPLSRNGEAELGIGTRPVKHLPARDISVLIISHENRLPPALHPWV